VERDLPEQVSRPEPDTIASTLGFRVINLGRGELQYVEGNHSVFIDSEGVMGPARDIVVYADSLRKWDPPYESEIVDDANRERIFCNVERALASEGIKVDFA
jgi:Immunity protein 74